ncbi:MULTISPECIES: amidohydrolase [unclassified Sphingobium]|uniref:amidohydrolase n=1 Tax=unclassified Sphingobium TaxID=2611147 RepID=UPI0022240073|nr:MULTISPECIES: amidohydrolase [unclassified Sphingobium]MCW2381667.1 hippurate hydrolase [Sphingobium sp. B2D3B]MCW2398226.1 hippurate hydrolase [Sphingobium sp. B2D3C]
MSFNEASNEATAASHIDATIDAALPELLEIYRDLHANPELSFQEVRTAATLAARVRALGFAVTEQVGQTGVVAVLENGPGPVVMIRADMDALPLEEKTGLPYASTVRATTRDGIESPVMHACGHDTHMTAWTGAAQALMALRARWSGTLVMILQPAEEIGLGAKAMLDDGLFTRFPKPSHVLAFHDSAELAAGTIGYTPGWILANVDSVDLTVRGQGGHGAYPHKTIDPIVIAARIVTSLQTLVSRECDPQEAAVVTVGSFVAGAKHNVIPDEAKLLITVRSYSDETRARLLGGIERIARGEAMAAGVPEDRMPIMAVEQDYTPATYNTPQFSDHVAGVLRAHFGADRVRQVPSVMGGEDFGQYHRADNSIESMIFWVGGVDPDKVAAARRGEISLPSLHSPLWAPDPHAVIGTAAKALTVAALDIFGKS